MVGEGCRADPKPPRQPSSQSIFEQTEIHRSENFRASTPDSMGPNCQIRPSKKIRWSLRPRSPFYHDEKWKCRGFFPFSNARARFFVRFLPWPWSSANRFTFGGYNLPIVYYESLMLSRFITTILTSRFTSSQSTHPDSSLAVNGHT